MGPRLDAFRCATVAQTKPALSAVPRSVCADAPRHLAVRNLGPIVRAVMAQRQPLVRARYPNYDQRTTFRRRIKGRHGCVTDSSMVQSAGGSSRLSSERGEVVHPLKQGQRATAFSGAAGMNGKVSTKRAAVFVDTFSRNSTLWTSGTWIRLPLPDLNRRMAKDLRPHICASRLETLMTSRVRRMYLCTTSHSGIIFVNGADVLSTEPLCARTGVPQSGAVLLKIRGVSVNRSLTQLVGTDRVAAHRDVPRGNEITTSRQRDPFVGRQSGALPTVRNRQSQPLAAIDRSGTAGRWLPADSIAENTSPMNRTVRTIGGLEIPMAAASRSAT